MNPLGVQFVPSQWREIWKGGNGLSFKHLDKLNVCASKDNDKVYTLPHSSLWCGVPDALSSKQFLQPGDEVNGLSCDEVNGLSCDEVMCSPLSLEDPQCDSVTLKDNTQTTEDCVSVSNESIIVLDKSPSLETNNCVINIATSPEPTTSHVRADSPIVIAESEAEDCLPKKKKSPLPGLSTIYQKLSYLCVQSATLPPSPVPDLLVSPSPVLHDVSAKRTVERPSFSPLSDASKTVLSSYKRHQVVDLTQDDDVICIDDDVSSERKKKNDNYSIVISDDTPVATCCGILLTEADFNTLRPNCWLNDQVINAFMKLLMKFYNTPKQGFTRTPQKGSTLVHIVSTFFYRKLRSSGYSGVERWLRKVDMYRLQLLLVPVHLGSHWCLAAINFRNKSISYFDSMGGRNPVCLKTLRLFLIRCALEGKSRSVRYWRLCHPKGVPQQRNCSDCGVFVCQFALWLCSTGAKKLARFHSRFPFSHKHMTLCRTLMIEQLKHETLYPNIHIK